MQKWLKIENSAETRRWDDFNDVDCFSINARVYFDRFCFVFWLRRVIDASRGPSGNVRITSEIRTAGTGTWKLKPIETAMTKQQQKKEFPRLATLRCECVCFFSWNQIHFQFTHLQVDFVAGPLYFQRASSGARVVWVPLLRGFHGGIDARVVPTEWNVIRVAIGSGSIGLKESKPPVLIDWPDGFHGRNRECLSFSSGVDFSRYTDKKR